jgi:hypothetical protein
MATIRAAHYGETVEQLKADPIVHAMAAAVAGSPRDELAHPDGTPRHEFMGHANAEYDLRGGRVTGHLGAVAEALLALLDEEPVAHFFDTQGEERRLVTAAKFRRYEIRPGVQVTTSCHPTERHWQIVSVEEPRDAEEFRLVRVEPVE